MNAPLCKPVGEALDGAGHLYIADSCDNAIRELILSTGIITTVAGTGPGGTGYTGDGGPATQAELNGPSGVALDSAGDLYIADTTNNVIRKVAAGTGIITTVAGTGVAGSSGDGGAATQAEMNKPAAVAVDSQGNLFIADTNSYRVREVVAATGIITTVAGTGTSISSGDGGPAIQAGLGLPTGVTVDGTGNLFIADQGADRIRKVDAATGIISTVAGGTFCHYPTQTPGCGDGGPATQAELTSPTTVAVDGAGNLFIADSQDERVREVVATTGIITSVAGFTRNITAGYRGDGGPATSALLNGPAGVVVDSSGNLFIADTHNYRMREVIASTGIITTIAGIGNNGGYGGDGGPDTKAALNYVTGVTVDTWGNLFIADAGNDCVREVLASTGAITTVAGISSLIGGYSGDGGLATSAQLNYPSGVAVDGAGNLYIVDSGNSRVREVNARTGIITTVAGTGTAGYNGDGIPATQAQLNSPTNLTLDGSGNIYIADASNNRVREVIASTGIITTVAGTGMDGYNGDGIPATQAQLGYPTDVAVDPDGNLYVADDDNSRVREVIARTGLISTVAGTGRFDYTGDGGPATQAQLDDPMGVALDGTGNLFIADSDNNVVREVVAATGIITTVAGIGDTWGYSGDGGSATQATVSEVNDVATDAAGNLFIADTFNNAVRIVGSIGAPTVRPGGLVPWHPHHDIRLSQTLQASVDLADGHLDLHVQGLSIPGRGPALSVNHVWDSTLAQAGITTTAGQGWFDSLTPSIGGTLTGTLTYTDSSGAAWPLQYSGSLTATSPYTAYAVPAGQPWQLTTSTAGYTLTDYLSGATRSFDGQGRLLSDADAYTNSNTLAYTSSAALPMTITNSGGRALSLYYNGNGLLSAAQSPLDRATANHQGQLVAYGYSPNTAQLTTMAWGYGTADQRVATFAYSGTQLITVTTPGGHAWSIGYDSLGRVSYLASPAAGATPPYATVFSYQPGQTIVVQGYKQYGQLATAYTLDGQGEATAIVDAYGNTTRYSYDADHDVLTRTDANTHVTTNYYQYVGPPGPSGLGSSGLITETDRPAGSDQVPVTTTYGYDPQSYDLLTTTTGAGSASGYGLTYFAYDGHHSVITTTQQLGLSGCGAGMHSARQSAAVPHRAATQSQSCQPGLTWRASVNRYDPFGELVATVDGRGLDVSPTSAQGVPSPTLNALAAASTHSDTYTAQGDLAQSGTPPITTISGTAPVTTSYAYDLDGNASTRTSPNDNTTSASYDHLGRLTLTTQPRVALYDGSTTDGAGDLTRSSYDPLGRLVATTDPISGTTLYTYTATTLAQVRDPAGHLTTYGYDWADRPITLTDPSGATTRYGYDAVGNTVAITTPLDYSHPNTVTVETRGYDALNRVISDTVGGSGESSPTPPQTTLYGYDHDGNTTQVQAPNGDVSTRWYDDADRLSQANVFPDASAAPLSPPPAASAGYTLDAADNPIDQLDFSQDDHQASFDGDNRPTQVVDTCGPCLGAPAITTVPSYDPDGNVLSLTRQEGTVQTAAYNALDWLSSQDDGQGATSYGYDAAGRLRTQSLLGGTASGVVTDTVNAAGWLTASSDTVTDTGQAPTSSSSLFTDTPDGLPSAVTLNTGAGQLQEIRQYDLDNRLTQVQATGPATVSAPLSSTDAYTYNPQGQTTVITSPNPYGSGLFVQQLSHDATGRLMAQNAAGGPTAYPYLWTYDGNGNMLTDAPPNRTLGTTYVYTYTQGMTPATWLPNELIATVADNNGNQTVYGYDSNGNIIAMPPTVGGVTSLTYNAQARPASVSLPDGTSIGLGYNALGLRATLTMTPAGQTQPAVGERFRYRNGVVGQVVVTGTASFTETFLYRPNGAPLELLYQLKGQATQRYWYVLNGHGDVVALVDKNGSVVNSYAYDPWGAIDTYASTPLSEAIPQPLRYAGYWYDGWYYNGWTAGTYHGATPAPPWYWLRVRYYNPSLRRFLQPDPSSLDGVRSYAYAHDDPVDLVDPTGLYGDDGEANGGIGSGGAGSGLRPAIPGEGTVGLPGGVSADLVQLSLPFANDANLATATSDGNTDLAPAARSGGARSTSGRNLANENGDYFHYDKLNSDYQRETGPTQLSNRYPETRFIFGKQGVSEPDVTIAGGVHPADYEGSTWPTGYDYGDFKPLRSSGRQFGWYSFRADVRAGKIDPRNTIAIFYDPATNELYPEGAPRGGYRVYDPPYPPVWSGVNQEGPSNG